MTFFYVDPETYKRYRDQVLEYSNSIQVNLAEHLPPEVRKPPLSDEQIGERLGLEPRLVREIRCVAEREFYPIDEWERALEFKERACRGYAEGGLASVTKKYFKARKKRA